MKVSEIADYVEFMVPKLRLFADRNREIDIPSELVLTFLINFLTDSHLREFTESSIHRE